MHVGRVQAFRAVGDLELHPLPFPQGSVTVHLDSGEMDEYVLILVIRFHETVSLGIVEPLYDTGNHTTHSSKHLVVVPARLVRQAYC